MFVYGIVDVDVMLDETHYNIKWKTGHEPDSTHIQ